MIIAQASKGEPSAAAHRILRSPDGGPIRDIWTGRETKWIEGFVGRKTDFRMVHAESPLEINAMEILELSPRVFSFMAQPHRLEMNSREGRSVYFPDLEALVDPSLVAELNSGVAFSNACLSPVEPHYSVSEAIKLVLELKTKKDRRMENSAYQEKLRNADLLYADQGYVFKIYEENRNFGTIDLRWVHDVAVDNFTKLDFTCKRRAIEHLKSYGGISTVGALANCLDDHLEIGIAVLHALVSHRLVAIDFSSPRTLNSPVVRVAS